MASRLRLPETARGRALLVAASVVVFGAIGIVAGTIPRTETPIAGIGLTVPASVPIAARFPVSTTSPRGSTTTPPTAATTTSPVPPTQPVDVVFTPPASGAPAISEPVPVPTTGPRTLMAPAITATLPPAPPPPALGADALTWTAPASLDIPAGTTAPLTVVAHNPTDRNVDLPHPLACTPRLDHAETCAPEVQRIAANTSASATYTIDAQGIAPGDYTLSIEGVLTIAVTVS